MSKYCRTRYHLHSALSQDGWILPSKHSAICTTDFMLRVRDLSVFCPQRDNVQIKLCFAPPPWTILQAKLESAIIALEARNEVPANERNKVHRLIGHLRLRPANVDWYLALLSFFNPEDPIFAKNYKYVREAEIPVEPMINNDDGLFTNLPELTEQEMRKTNRMRLPK